VRLTVGNDCIVHGEVVEKLVWHGARGQLTRLTYRAAAQLCLNNSLRDGTLDIDKALFEADSQAAAYLEWVRKVIHDTTFFESTSATSESIS
jgi:hypothetical protein